jgi:hypothetical protein
MKSTVAEELNTSLVELMIDCLDFVMLQVKGREAQLVSNRYTVFVFELLPALCTMHHPSQAERLEIGP